MKKKVRKIIILILISLMFISSFVYAEDTISTSDYKPATIGNGGKIVTIGNIIIGAIQLIGSILSVIVLVIIGIKFITGSVEEKAEYKQSLMPYVIGAIMVFSISNILGIVSQIMS